MFTENLEQFQVTEVTGWDAITQFKWNDEFAVRCFNASLIGFPPFQELLSQLDSQGKMDSASFQALVTSLAQRNLAAAEKQDLEQYESRVQAWETERRELIRREKEMRAKAEQEKQERLAAISAAQHV